VSGGHRRQGWCPWDEAPVRSTPLRPAIVDDHAVVVAGVAQRGIDAVGE